MPEKDIDQAIRQAASEENRHRQKRKPENGFDASPAIEKSSNLSRATNNPF